MWQDDENDDDKARDKAAPGAKLGRASELFSFIINDALAYFSGTWFVRAKCPKICTVSRNEGMFNKWLS